MPLGECKELVVRINRHILCKEQKVPEKLEGPEQGNAIKERQDERVGHRLGHCTYYGPYKVPVKV